MFSQKTTATWFLFVGLLLLLGLLWSFAAPAPAQAHPPFGLTLTPTSDAPPPTPEPTPTPDDSDNPDDSPTHTIDLQVSCNLICPDGSQVSGAQFPVQLIHQGSGWIVDATIGSGGVSHFAVPYPGQWEVIITGPPSYDSSVQMIVPDSYPLSAGTVWADSGTQTVSCPIACLEIIATPELLLPQTGQALADDPFLIFISGLAVLAAGLLWTILNDQKR